MCGVVCSTVCIFPSLSPCLPLSHLERGAAHDARLVLLPRHAQADRTQVPDVRALPRLKTGRVERNARFALRSQVLAGGLSRQKMVHEQRENVVVAAAPPPVDVLALRNEAGLLHRRGLVPGKVQAVDRDAELARGEHGVHDVAVLPRERVERGAPLPAAPVPRQDKDLDDPVRGRVLPTVAKADRKAQPRRDRRPRLRRSPPPQPLEPFQGFPLGEGKGGVSNAGGGSAPPGLRRRPPDERCPPRPCTDQGAPVRRAEDKVRVEEHLERVQRGVGGGRREPVDDEDEKGGGRGGGHGGRNEHGKNWFPLLLWVLGGKGQNVLAWSGVFERKGMGRGG